MNVLNVILSHQLPKEIVPVLRRWDDVCERNHLLLAYGGSKRNFVRVAHEPKVFVDDPRLRVGDGQREYQSMTGLYKAVRTWVRSTKHEFAFVFFGEFDHLPLVPDLNRRQIERLKAEGADVLAHGLQRIDGTSHPHYLYHLSSPGFLEWFAKISVRSERNVILSMLGTGSFWRREAFEAIGERDEPFPMYNEVYVPSLAHHLGFRVRDWAEQNTFVRNLGDFRDQIDTARASGAWTVHPVKHLPESV